MDEPTFRCRCVCCGKVEDKQPTPGEGPACSKCYGPMVLERVEVKRANRKERAK